jgi:hypothetical protein
MRLRGGILFFEDPPSAVVQFLNPESQFPNLLSPRLTVSLCETVFLRVPAPSQQVFLSTVERMYNDH